MGTYLNESVDCIIITTTSVSTTGMSDSSYLMGTGFRTEKMVPVVTTPENYDGVSWTIDFHL